MAELLRIPSNIQSSKSTQLKQPQVYWITIQTNFIKIQPDEIHEDQIEPWEIHKVELILQKIAHDYATLRFYNYSKKQEDNDKMLQNIMKRIKTSHQNYKLTERKMCIVGLKQDHLNAKKLQNILKRIKTQHQNYKLTKRKMVIVVLINQQFDQYLGTLFSQPNEQRQRFYKKKRYYKRRQQCNYIGDFPISNWIKFTNLPSILHYTQRIQGIMDDVNMIDIHQSEQIITKQLIKVMQLDFVWLGILNRIGADTKDLQYELIKNQRFNLRSLSFYIDFIKHLNKLLIKNNQQLTQQLLNRLLAQCSLQCLSLTPQINQLTELLIQYQFNSRTIIRDIIYGQNLNLLLSRNYFHLLFIEGNTMIRYKRFSKQCKELGLDGLFAILTVQNFITIDDYWYQNYILKCLPFVKQIINRADSKEPYSRLIQKNHQLLVPSFRPSFDQYFINICNVLKNRSGCVKQSVGSIIVKNKRIIATGYNGTPMDTLNCFNGGCKVCNNSNKINTQVLSCSCIHAQYGCILQAGIKITPGATLYSTKLPCLWCTKLIVQGKISKVVYMKSKYESLEYQNMSLIKQIYSQANISLVQFDKCGVHFTN